MRIPRLVRFSVGPQFFRISKPFLSKFITASRVEPRPAPPSSPARNRPSSRQAPIPCNARRASSEVLRTGPTLVHTKHRHTTPPSTCSASTGLRCLHLPVLGLLRDPSARGSPKTLINTSPYTFRSNAGQTGSRDSPPRPSPGQGEALPAELLPPTLVHRTYRR
jgi:hypothetical protein